MQSLLPSYPSVENQGRSSLDNLPGQSAHQETPQSPQDPISRTSQGPLLFNSGPSPNESAQPVPLHFHPPMNMLMHNPADTPSTTSTSASPATPTNASPVSNSSIRLSAIQTVQNYLTHQAQAIQSFPALFREKSAPSAPSLHRRLVPRFLQPRRNLLGPPEIRMT